MYTLAIPPFMTPVTITFSFVKVDHSHTYSLLYMIPRILAASHSRLFCSRNNYTYHAQRREYRVRPNNRQNCSS